MNDIDQNKMMTVAEAAEYAKVGKDMIYEWVHDGLPHYKLGNRFCFSVKDLIAWLQQYRTAIKWRESRASSPKRAALSRASVA